MRLNNGNVINENGKVTFVSIESFKSEICNSEVCIICAKKLESETQNKEHVIPNWILNRFDLHNKRVQLPNGSRLRYGQYVIPCCVKCNSLLSAELETPLSKAFSSGFDNVIEYVEKNGFVKIYIWLALIFIKTHIKDKSLRMHLNENIEFSSIADGIGHEWESFHHIYCLSRIPYTKATFDENCIGSIFFVAVNNGDAVEDFDYMDISFANTSGIIVNNVGVIAVFGDAGAVQNQLQSFILNRINSSVTSMQFRELVANFACCNLHLKNPPKHFTLSHDSEKVPPHMMCQLAGAKPEFEDYIPEVFGNIMDMLLGNLLSGKVNITNFREQLREGKLSIIFDKDGCVISNQNSSKTEQD